MIFLTLLKTNLGTDVRIIAATADHVDLCKYAENEKKTFDCILM